MASSSEEDIESDLDSEIYYIEDYVFENSDDEVRETSDECRLSDHNEQDNDGDDGNSDDGIELGIEPFMFEPTANLVNNSSDEGENDEDNDEDEEEDEKDEEGADNVGIINERAGNKDGCTCGECQVMENYNESICCPEQESIPDEHYEGVNLIFS